MAADPDAAAMDAALRPISTAIDAQLQVRSAARSSLHAIGAGDAAPPC
jgi:hypothetical protein